MHRMKAHANARIVVVARQHGEGGFVVTISYSRDSVESPKSKGKEGRGRMI